MASLANPQYQHFVPQFLLRNFSHPYKPDGDGPRRRRGGRNRKYEKGMHPKDPVVWNLDLLAEPPTICEKPVKRILGRMNMYQDTNEPAERQQHVEQMLSVLERETSAIFRKITKAFEQKEEGLWLTRSERNLLRKFLFLLKYRSDGFRRRFFHQNPEDYSEDDRERMLEYMAAHDFKRPLDVWFHNIKTIVEVDMDTDNEWMMRLRKQMYPDDAMWFYVHVNMYYMAVCTPTDPGIEFILTDNCYGVFEGPNNFAEDVETGEIGNIGHTPLHYFAPISPKLMIVLRCNILPNPLEDAAEELKENRTSMRSLALSTGLFPDAKSLLAELPVEKARNNYTQIVDGRITMLGGQGWKPRLHHKFCFTFFRIGSEHLHTINAILLDNVATCTSVVFGTREGFAQTVEWYLTAPCTVGKILTGSDVDLKLREAALKKLETVSRELGSQKETVFIRVPNIPMKNYAGFLRGHVEWRREMDRIIDGNDGGKSRGNKPRPKGAANEQSNTPTHFSRTYDVLGGSMATILQDLDQAFKMFNLRVKIDAWSKGKVDEATRERNRRLLVDAYLRLPPRRVWLFIKYCRLVMLTDSLGIEGGNEAASTMPEDTVARAEQVVQPDALSRLIYLTGMNDIEMKMHPYVDLWSPSTEQNLGATGLWGKFILLMRVLFQNPGFIRDCGIPEIRELARQAQIDIQKKRRQSHWRPESMVFEEGEMIELLTRMWVRERAKKTPRLRDIAPVLFGTAYPTPPPNYRGMP